MGNNQALQVGAESLGVFVAGLMAAVVVKLPLAVFGGVLVLAALLLVPFRRPALGDVSGKGGQHGRENDRDVAMLRGFDTAHDFIVEARHLPPWGRIQAADELQDG